MKTSMNRIWIYGLNFNNDVVKTTWRDNTVTDDKLEEIAENWKANYGCERVFAMFDSRELNDMWLCYVRSANLKNGMADFIKIEMIDYLESGDWELDKGN